MPGGIEYRGGTVRPRRLGAGAALTAALALVALPGLAGSRTPDAHAPIPAAALQQLTVPARAVAATRIDPLDPDVRSAGFVAPDSPFVEPGADVAPIPGRPSVDQPDTGATSVRRPPRLTIRGIASFYDHGTTAMRLPRGTLVVICGGGGCIERRITDYGPSAAVHPERVADLYRADFFAICGCPSWSGTTTVTVSVY
jgi:hypothetical protein